MIQVYVVHVWDGTDESEGVVCVYSNFADAERDAKGYLSLLNIDHAAVDFTLTEKDRANGYTLHAVYGPNDAVVSVRRVPVR